MSKRNFIKRSVAVRQLSC